VFNEAATIAMAKIGGTYMSRVERHCHHARAPRSLADHVIENQTVFNVVSALCLIPAVIALLLWGTARFFYGVANNLFDGSHSRQARMAKIPTG
jgi:hypothetical protein